MPERLSHPHITPPDFGVRGVQYNPPELERGLELLKKIDESFSKLPADTKGALIGVANEKGANAVIITRFHRSWTIEAWVGKQWEGSYNYGAQVIVTW